MSALTSSCLSFPISGVAGVSHPPLEAVLCLCPGKHKHWMWLRTAATGLGRTQRAPGVSRTPGTVPGTLAWNLHRRVFEFQPLFYTCS